MEQITGYKGIADFFGISEGKARTLVQNNYLPSPINEIRGRTGRTIRTWSARQLEVIRPFISLPPSELIQNLRRVLEEPETVLESIECKNDPLLLFGRLHPIFDNYLQQFKGRTEAPLEYIAASFLTSLGAAIGNRMILKRGKGVMPNIYLMLVGASTFMRKSTSINLGLKPIKSVNKELYKKFVKERAIYQELYEQWAALPKLERIFAELPEPPNDFSILFPDQVTPEQFLAKLADRPDKLLYFDEIGRFLAMIKSKTSLGFKEMLTELFDKEFGDTYIRETKTSGNTYIESPCVSFIGASTFEWLQTHLSRRAKINWNFGYNFLWTDSIVPLW